MTLDEAKLLIGTRWKRRNTNNDTYVVLDAADKNGLIYVQLKGEFQTGRKSWKWARHLDFDYERIP